MKGEDNMEQAQNFKAKIAGKEYTIVGKKSANHLNAVVDIVNNQLEQLNELAPELTYSDRSILMSVNAVSDQLAKEQQIVDLETEIESLKKQLNSMQAEKTQFKNNQSSSSHYSRRDQKKPKSNLFDESQRVSRQVPFERN